MVALGVAVSFERGTSVPPTNPRANSCMYDFDFEKGGLRTDNALELVFEVGACRHEGQIPHYQHHLCLRFRFEVHRLCSRFGFEILGPEF